MTLLPQSDGADSPREEPPLRKSAIVLAACLVTALAGPAMAQAPDAKAPQSSVDPDRLAAAREVIAAAQGDRKQVLAAMRTPMTGMMQQMIASRDPKAAERAPILVDEVVMPMLLEHYDELLSVQALSFAAVLSIDDLKAVAAFYQTPAGRNLVKAQPQLAQAQLTGMKQWMATLMPEMQRKVMDAAKTHGWLPGGDKKP